MSRLIFDAGESNIVTQVGDTLYVNGEPIVTGSPVSSFARRNEDNIFTGSLAWGGGSPAAHSSLFLRRYGGSPARQTISDDIGLPILTMNNGTFPLLSIGGAGPGAAFIQMQRYNASIGGPDFAMYHSKSGTMGTHTALQSGDEIGSISFHASNGTSTPIKAARIIGFVSSTTGSPALTDFPSRIDIRNLPDGGGGGVAGTLSTTASFSTAEVELNATLLDFNGNLDAITVTGAAGAGSIAVLVNNALPRIALDESDAAADNQVWYIDANAEQFAISVVNDALDTVSDALRIDRTGTTVDNVNLLATTVDVTGNFQVSGTAAVAGVLTVGSPQSTIPAAAINADTALTLVDRGSLSTTFLAASDSAHSIGIRNISAGGTFSAPSAITTTNTSYIGFIGGGGYDGTNWQTASAGLVGIRPTGTWSDTQRPTRVTIETTPLLSTARAVTASFDPAEVDLTATVLDFNGTADISGTLAWGGGAIISSSSNVAVLGSPNTFTSAQRFTASGAGSTTSAISISAAAPFLNFTETDQSADATRWLFGASAGVFHIGPVSDAATQSQVSQGIHLTRSTTTVTEIQYDATLHDMNGILSVSGTAVFGAGSPLGGSGDITIAKNSASLYLDATDAASNEKVWRITQQTGSLTIQTRTDANTAGANVITLLRTGTTSTEIDLTSTEVEINVTTFDVNATSTDFSNVVDVNGQFSVNNQELVHQSTGGSIMRMRDTDAATNLQRWRMRTINGTWLIASEDDSGVQVAQPLTITKFGSPATGLISSIQLIAATLDLDGNLDADGTTMDIDGATSLGLHGGSADITLSGSTVAVVGSATVTGSMTWGGGSPLNSSSNIVRRYGSPYQQFISDGPTLPLLRMNGAIPLMSIGGSAAGAGFIQIQRYNSAGGGPDIAMYHSKSNTVGTHVTLQNGDEIGSISFNASNGTSTPVKVARIIAIINGNGGSPSDLPSRIDFLATPDNSVTPTTVVSMAPAEVDLTATTLDFNGDIDADGTTFDIDAATSLTLHGGSVDFVMSSTSATLTASTASITGTLRVGTAGATSNPLQLFGNDAIGDNYIGFYEDDLSTRKGYLGYGNTGDDAFYMANEESAGSLLFQTASTTRITVSSTGPVTFAASAPVTISSTLDITGATTAAGNISISKANPVLVLNDSTGSPTTVTAYVSFQTSSTERGWFGFGADTDDMAWTNNVGAISLSSGGGEGITLNGGIEVELNGTTLDFNGAADFSGVVHAGAGSHAEFQLSPTLGIATAAANNFLEARDSTNDISGIFGTDTVRVVVAAFTNHDLALRTSNIDRIYIENDGSEIQMDATLIDVNANIDVSGTVTTPNTSASEVGFKGIPAIRSISSSDNTAASDAGGKITFSGGSGQTFTLDSDPPAGSMIWIHNQSGNTWSIAATTLHVIFNAQITTTSPQNLQNNMLTWAIHHGSGFWTMYGFGNGPA